MRDPRRPHGDLLQAGRSQHGKMKTAYFWPIYGELDEICFPYFPSREGENVYRALGEKHPPGAVLLTALPIAVTLSSPLHSLGAKLARHPSRSYSSGPGPTQVPSTLTYRTPTYCCRSDV